MLARIARLLLGEAAHSQSVRAIPVQCKASKCIYGRSFDNALRRNDFDYAHKPTRLLVTEDIVKTFEEENLLASGPNLNDFFGDCSTKREP